MEIEELEGFACEECGATFDTEEAHEMHMEDHEMVMEQEEMSAEDQAILIKGLLMSVHAEEHRLKKLYGYKIPKSTEKLSTADLEGLEREMQVRDAMTRYVRVATGEEDFDPSNWYVAPQKEFDPKDYKLGENVFKITHYTTEHEEQIMKELGEKPPIAKLAEDIIKGKYNEPLPGPKTEQLAKDPYQEITEKLWKLFEPLWEDSKFKSEKDRGRQFNEVLLLNLGKEVFRYMRCPIENCDFRVPRKLSRKGKYTMLVKHFIKDHLSQVQGKAQLAAVKRFIASPAEDAIEAARKEFTNPREEGDDESVPGKLMPHQTGSPNPEQCSASFEQLTKDKLPKDDSLPPVSERRGLFAELKEVTDRGTSDLARAFSDIVPTPEEMEEVAQEFAAFYYETPKGIVCKICGAKGFKDIRVWLVHVRQGHPKHFRRPSHYKKYYQNR